MTRTSCAVVAAMIAVFVLAGCGGSTVGPSVALSPSTSQAPPLPCPATAIEPPPSGPASVVVAGTPDRATVCRYGGLNEPDAHRLVRSAVLTGAPLAKLVGALNGERVWPAGVLYQCLVDFGQYDVLLFGYPDGHQAVVRASLSGCASVANGKRTVSLGDDVRQQLIALVGSWPRP